ncbi:unnamed protein product, partial [Mesorhabditis belari]|uniref:Uncharacterized protein n=1 Tax=Mesorhabditis belari TaxID=2138241 RepID=A0AAF3F0G9_9BILA
MTYFPPDELIACIRHELHAEDETGLCDKLFPPLDRRAKFGGVPLGFRTHYDEHDDQQQFYIDLVDEDEQLGTSSIIEQRLRARTQDSDTENQRPIVPIFTSTLTNRRLGDRDNK